jgi:hypothetical protein
MTSPLPHRGHHLSHISSTVYCGLHSDPGAGVRIFACGVPTSRCSECPCEIADRYLVVDAASASLRWWQCADVLICPPQSNLPAASRATRTALLRLPGCTLAVAPQDGLGRVVLRTRDDVGLVSGPPVGRALLAAYAHRHQRGGGGP